MIQFTSKDGMLVLAAIEYVEPADEAALLATCADWDRENLIGSFAMLRTETARLNDAATPEQRAITWGDYIVVRWTPPPGIPFAQPLPPPIYGQVMTLPELARRERASGAAEAEITAECARTERHAAAGWRYGHWFSSIEPDGDLGDHHIAHMERITPAQFRRAFRAGWPEDADGSWR